MIQKNFEKKENKTVGLAIPDFKTNHKAAVMKIIFLFADREDGQDCVQCLKLYKSTLSSEIM